jgi:hypothetical protein
MTAEQVRSAVQRLGMATAPETPPEPEKPVPEKMVKRFMRPRGRRMGRGSSSPDPFRAYENMLRAMRRPSRAKAARSKLALRPAPD